MKRILACLVLAVAVAGCGGGVSSDEHDAALQRIAELEAELEQASTVAPTTTKAPATTTTEAPATTTTEAPFSDAECKITKVESDWVYWEVTFVNSKATRTKFTAEVDFLNNGEWVGSEWHISDETPPGQRVVVDSLENIGASTLAGPLTCEIYEIRW